MFIDLPASSAMHMTEIILLLAFDVEINISDACDLTFDK